MDQSNSGTQIVVRLDQRVFYGLIAVIGVIGIFGLGIFLGRSLNRSGGLPVAQQSQQVSGQPANLQVQPGQQVQINPAQAAQSQSGQANPFVGPAESQAKLPAGDDVAVGDNPRLAIPELKDKNYVFDFGDVKPDQKVEKTFKIKNSGSKDLVIADVKGNCGCTGTFLDPNKKTLAPGTETDLLVTYDPRVNKDKGVFISRKVRISSNDPAASVAEFTITANVTN